MLVRRMLRAAGIRVRHPNRRQTERIGEHVIGQRAAEIRQHRRRLSGGLSDRIRRPFDPGAVEIGARGDKAMVEVSATQSFVASRTDFAAHLIQGLSKSVREATKLCVALTSTIGNPCSCKCARTASTTWSNLVPTTNRSCSTARACPGMALAGLSILPDDIANTSSVFQA